MEKTTHEEIVEVLLNREPFTVPPGMADSLELVMETKAGILMRSVPMFRGGDIHLTTGIKYGLMMSTVDPAHVATVRTHIPVEPGASRRTPGGNGLVIHKNLIAVLEWKYLRAALKGIKPKEDVEVLYEESNGKILFRTSGGTRTLQDETFYHGRNVKISNSAKAKFFRSTRSQAFAASVMVKPFRNFLSECKRRDIGKFRIAASPEGIELLAYDGRETVIEPLKVSYGLCKVTKWDLEARGARGVSPEKGWIASLFSLDYAQMLFNAIPAKNSITIRVGQDYPLSAEWEHDGGRTSILIAPRLEFEG